MTEKKTEPPEHAAADSNQPRGDHSITAAIAAGALRKCHEDLHGDAAKAACSADILRKFVQSNQDMTVSVQGDKLVFGPPNFGRIAARAGSDESIISRTGAVADGAAQPGFTPKEGQPLKPAPNEKSTTTEIEVNGQKGTKTATERRDQSGAFLSGTIQYDGVRIDKVLPIDDGTSTQARHFSGIKQTDMEQTPNGVRLTLKTDNGDFRFMKTQSGWATDADLSAIPLEPNQPKGPGAPAAPGNAPALPLETPGASAPGRESERLPQAQAPFIPTDGAPQRQDVAPEQQAAPQEVQERLIGLQRMLMDQNVSSADKLKAVHALHAEGVEQFQLRDADGNARTYTIKEAPLGQHTMVHLFAAGDDGKEHIVLRAVMDSNGEMHQERGRDGQKVNLEGDYWSRNMAGKTPFNLSDGSGMQPQSRPAAPDQDDVYGFDGNRHRRAQPSEGGLVPGGDRQRGLYIPRDGDQGQPVDPRYQGRSAPYREPYIPRDGDQQPQPYPEAPRRAPHTKPSPGYEPRPGVAPYDQRGGSGLNQDIESQLQRYDRGQGPIYDPSSPAHTVHYGRSRETVPSKIENPRQFMHDLAQSGRNVGSAQMRADSDCAGGFRAAANATHQGFHIEGPNNEGRFRSGTQMGAYLAQSGLFDAIPLENVPKLEPGMIKVSHWNKAPGAQYNPSTGQSFFSKEDLGDIQIVGDGGTVHPDGGRYANSYVLVPKGYYGGQNRPVETAQAPVAPQEYAPQYRSAYPAPNRRQAQAGDAPPVPPTYRLNNGYAPQDAAPVYPAEPVPVYPPAYGQGYGAYGAYPPPPMHYRHHHYYPPRRPYLAVNPLAIMGAMVGAARGW